MVLVCDVGGGTSDFSLIRVSREGDLVNFTRTAVGKHLLLGGDNLDLTLAWLVETKLGVPLSMRQRSGLRRQCSAAKEKLLNDPDLKGVEITVLGSGSSLIGKSLKTEILREEVLELALEGFLPFSAARRSAQGREAQPVPRAGAALRDRPGGDAPSERVPGDRGAGARRHPFQRRLLHPRDSAGARGGRGGPMVRAAAGDPGKQRARSRGGARRGVLLLRAVHRQRRAGARRAAADLLHRAGRSARRQVPGGVPGAARRRGRRGHRNR